MLNFSWVTGLIVKSNPKQLTVSEILAKHRYNVSQENWVVKERIRSQALVENKFKKVSGDTPKWYEYVDLPYFLPLDDPQLEKGFLQQNGWRNVVDVLAPFASVIKISYIGEINCEITEDIAHQSE